MTEDHSNSLVHPPSSTLAATPSTQIRDEYYRAHGREESIDDLYEAAAASVLPAEAKQTEQQQQEAWTMYSYYAPLKGHDASSVLSSDLGSVISLRTEIDNDDCRSLASMQTTDSGAFHQRKKIARANTLFRSRTGAEPKIVLDNDDSNSKESPGLKRTKSRGGTLLSRLSKTTAPMRAKLSAMSRSGSSQDLRPTLHEHYPLRRSAESMLNMPISSPTIMKKKPLPRVSQETQHTFALHVAPEHGNITAASYPALLSAVAAELRHRVTIETKIKDSIEYKDAFDGKHAVDKLALIIKTTDRNLALLLGRAIDSQKFFHDVNYEHRLRDSSSEHYQFRQQQILALPHQDEDEDDEDERSIMLFSNKSAPSDDPLLPNGVFTLLTDCYSPTCSRERLCYSPICPRRLEQQRNKSLHRSSSRSSLNDKEDEGRLWITTVPKEVSSQLDAMEKKRQENIFELVYTEKDFVNDLGYLEKFWIKPLLEDEECLEASQRAAFVQDVFYNVLEVKEVNAQLAAALEARQKEKHVVDQVGDIMLQYVALFGPFVQYGAHQMVGKYVFEKERSMNPAFAQFVERTERLPQSRKLELNGYLTKPTTRLGRYNLLLREILKHTPPDHPDQTLIPKAMNVIAEFLGDVNHETGKTESQFSLQLLAEKLSYKPPTDEAIMLLDLGNPQRKLIMKGSLKKKGSSSSESADLQVFVLDHCLLIVKSKFVQGEERYKIYKKPIPLALLSTVLPDHIKAASKAGSLLPYGRPSTSSSLTSLNSIDAIAAATTSASTSKGYPLTFNYLGRQGFAPVTLYATSVASRQQWMETVNKQRQNLMQKQKVFDSRPVSDRFFNALNRVNCAVRFGYGVLIGSDQGVYLKRGSNEGLIRILAMDKVSQIDVLERSDLILVLADKTLYTYSLSSLMDRERRGRKLSSHVSFFKVGTIMAGTPSEKTLVCYVKYSAITSTIRALEPHASGEKKKKKPSKLSQLMRGTHGGGIGAGSEGLKVYKDLYLPGEAMSIQYFKNILCVGSPKGFQMVDLASAEVQSVLDPNDQSHAAILGRENLRPISMFRHHDDGSILLCYDEMAFYIDKKGRRSRPDWMIQWEGHPTAFALSPPYIVAFDPTFVEIRHMDSGALVQVIPGRNVRCLQRDAQDEIYCAMDDPVTGTELVFELVRGAYEKTSV